LKRFEIIVVSVELLSQSLYFSLYPSHLKKIIRRFILFVKPSFAIFSLCVTFYKMGKEILRWGVGVILLGIASNFLGYWDYSQVLGLLGIGLVMLGYGLTQKDKL
jgi:O-antigen/teichoic acid export membrane protein